MKSIQILMPWCVGFAKAVNMKASINETYMVKNYCVESNPIAKTFHDLVKAETQS